MTLERDLVGLLTFDHIFLISGVIIGKVNTATYAFYSPALPQKPRDCVPNTSGLEKTITVSPLLGH